MAARLDASWALELRAAERQPPSPSPAGLSSKQRLRPALTPGLNVLLGFAGQRASANWRPRWAGPRAVGSLGQSGTLTRPAEASRAHEWPDGGRAAEGQRAVAQHR